LNFLIHESGIAHFLKGYVQRLLKFDNWIGDILCRDCLLKIKVIEGKREKRIEMTIRRGRRRKQLLVKLNL
jgi:hypothetical protein